MFRVPQNPTVGRAVNNTRAQQPQGQPAAPAMAPAQAPRQAQPAMDPRRRQMIGRILRQP